MNAFVLIKTAERNSRQWLTTKCLFLGECQMIDLMGKYLEFLAQFLNSSLHNHLMGPNMLFQARNVSLCETITPAPSLLCDVENNTPTNKRKLPS